MTVHALRDRVSSLVGKPCTPSLLCITGASGAGKTSVVTKLREHIPNSVLPTLHFDSLGVPSSEEMNAGWESPRGWQKAMTYHWVYTAKHVYRTHPLVVLEGQFDPQYAIAACSAHRIKSAVVLLHADDQVRTTRLGERGQPELATHDMANWASYLHESTCQLGGVVVDATPALEKVVDAICSHALSLVDVERDDEPADPRSRVRHKRIN